MNSCEDGRADEGAGGLYEEFTKVSASFGFRAWDLKPAEITARLGIEPSRAHARGDKYVGHVDKERMGVREQPWGVWAIDSEQSIQSTDPQDHIDYLVQLLTPKTAEIEALMGKEDMYVAAWLTVESCELVNSFRLGAQSLATLAALCHDINVLVIAPYEGEGHAA